MKSVAEARTLILENQKTGKPFRTKLADAFGFTLAEDVLSPVDLPLFDASAMDGFAVIASGLARASETSPVVLEVGEEIWAGKTPQKSVAPGICARIMTGAKMPDGADAVVMREHVRENGGKIAFNTPVPTGANVRRRGEEIRAGEKILAAGSFLNAASVALLASCGVAEPNVFPKPRVTVIPTGSELVPPGRSLTGAHLYESNSFALAAALAETGVPARVLPIVPDDAKALTEAVRNALENSTHVLMTGGVSVGDYDLNKTVLADSRVTPLLWKVAQKPGKPLYVGQRGDATVFGLPGNPASALTCFYEYVRPALLKYMGRAPRPGLPARRARLSEAIAKKAGLTHFVRGKTSTDGTNMTVAPLARQQSHMMASFAAADCLIVLPSEGTDFPAGAEVEIHLLPGKGDSCA